MKLGVVGFLAALAAAPLAAQAAEPPARFAVTLRATVSDKLSFDVTTSQEDCVINRSGTGGRELTIRSLRPTRILVTAGPVYRPSRVAVLVVGGAKGGAYKTTRRCRAGPFETTSGICKPNRSKPRPVRAAFRRSGRGALVFRGTSFELADACGLERLVAGSWLGIAPGSIDEAALLRRSSATIVAKGSASRETLLEDSPTAKITRQTMVRWTLTFRRLS